MRSEDKLIQDIQRAPSRKNPRITKNIADNEASPLSMKAIAEVQARQLASAREGLRAPWRVADPYVPRDNSALVNSVAQMVEAAKESAAG